MFTFTIALFRANNTFAITFIILRILVINAFICTFVRILFIALIIARFIITDAFATTINKEKIIIGNAFFSTLFGLYFSTLALARLFCRDTFSFTFMNIKIIIRNACVTTFNWSGVSTCSFAQLVWFYALSIAIKHFLVILGYARMSTQFRILLFWTLAMAGFTVFQTLPIACVKRGLLQTFSITQDVFITTFTIARDQVFLTFVSTLVGGTFQATKLLILIILTEGVVTMALS